MKNLIFIVLTLWMNFAFADGFFWVLGSYADKDVAMTEGRRVNSDTGVEVLMQETDVTGVRYYRLLTRIDEDGSEHADLRFQLKSAGIEEIWGLRIRGDLPVMQSMLGDPVIDRDMGNLFDEK